MLLKYISIQLLHPCSMSASAGPRCRLNSINLNHLRTSLFSNECENRPQTINYYVCILNSNLNELLPLRLSLVLAQQNYGIYLQHKTHIDTITQQCIVNARASFAVNVVLLFLCASFFVVLVSPIITIYLKTANSVPTAWMRSRCPSQ